MKAPPKHSFVDGNGQRFIFLDIDIMLRNGERFFTTFRYKAPVHYDFYLGQWCVEADGLSDELNIKYSFLRNRTDVRICLNEAKFVKRYNLCNNEKNTSIRRTVGKQF